MIRCAVFDLDGVLFEQKHYTNKQLKEAITPYNKIFFRPTKNYKKDHKPKTNTK
ncbi:MAG: hypothetical protein QW320_06130 [Ignisphaera sp.]